MCYIFGTMKSVRIIALLLFVGLIILNILSWSFSSPKLKNPAFSWLVNSLLAHDVTETSIESLKLANTEIVLLDTRSKEEYETSHIAGAIWVGYEAFDIESVKNIPRDKKIISYCSIGYRSEEITRKLRAAGFSNVSNLYGGIFEWVNQGGHLLDMQNTETDTLHVYKKIWGIWTSPKEKVY